MKENTVNNKLIAKNTLLLYIRQFLIMIVALYTSRIVLQTLGVTDYGINNVVAGVVTMFSFLTSTLASASQRYLSYDMAGSNSTKLKETFSLLILTFLLLAVLTVILSESIAVWFLNNKMTIPENRLIAANWVLQFTILTFVADIIVTPYLSVVIAHEKMDIYAYVSIFEVTIRLIIVFLLQVFECDKLILYSFLGLLCSVSVTLCYVLYCLNTFQECHYKFYYSKSRLLEMCSYAWWNMIGTFANLLRNHGINILLNLFFNPAINAARGIAYQVNSAITSFSSNFFTAVRPQIFKTYAAKEYENMRSLIVLSSRLSFYLLSLISLPILLNLKQILTLWLGDPPSYTVFFVQLVLITSLIEVFNTPIGAGMQATGRIKNYQLVVNGIYLLNLPISYFFLSKGYQPEITMYINLLLVIIDLMPRLLFAKKQYGLLIGNYFVNVILRCCIVTFACYIVGMYIVRWLNPGETFIGLFNSSFIVIVIDILFIFFLGINKGERLYLIKFVKEKIKK